MILDWYVFEPFVTRLDSSLYVLSCLAFLIAAARQVFRDLMQERLYEYDESAAIPAHIDVYGTQVINYLDLRWPPEPSSVYLPIHWTEFDSV